MGNDGVLGEVDEGVVGLVSIPEVAVWDDSGVVWVVSVVWVVTVVTQVWSWDFDLLRQGGDERFLGLDGGEMFSTSHGDLWGILHRHWKIIGQSDGEEGEKYQNLHLDV